MNSPQLSLALVVEENHGQVCERGNQSKSLAFDFLIHRFWEIRNHRRRWTHSSCSYLWLLKGWWTLNSQGWQMLMGCKLLYSFSLRNMLSERKVISNLSEQCLVAAVNLELALLYFSFILLQFLHLGAVILCGMSQANLLNLNLILAYFERWVFFKKIFKVRRVISTDYWTS